jgi:hypothetical protein
MRNNFTWASRDDTKTLSELYNGKQGHCRHFGELKYAAFRHIGLPCKIMTGMTYI